MTDNERLEAQAEPMAELPTAATAADLEAACQAEGHLLHDDPGGGQYCLRCPYTE